MHGSLVPWALLRGRMASIFAWGRCPFGLGACALYLLDFFIIVYSALHFLEYYFKFCAARTADGRCPLDRPTGLRSAQVIS